MWAKFAETLLKFLAVLLPSLVSYQAGKKSVESDMKDKVIEDVQKRQKIERDIANADADTVKRMSERWTTRE